MNKLRLFVVMLFLAPVLIFAQAAKAGTAAPAVEPSALIAYADDPSLVTILGSDGSSRTPDIGDEIAPGETMKSAGSTVELKLSPNGSILKIAKNTVFKLDGLQGKAGQTSNAISVIGGKIRTVAAKATAGNSYQFRTSTAVCGVRGTDFTLVVEQGLRDAVFVQKGLVDFAKLDATTGAALESVAVAAGQFADAVAETFAAADFTADQFPDVFDSDTEFVSLNPADVPETLPEEAAPAAVAPVAPVEAAPAEETAAQPATPEVKAQAESKFMQWLRETLGMQIGSITINGLTYSQAILQPTFAIGKLKMSLYLPIIYSSNLFDPKDWYHPKGNDEWSFGFDKGWDKDNWKEATLDAASDLALKIRYVEWGKQLIDPFYLKIGNLHDMTIGHGVIMNNFANDADFPAVRRVGFNMGFEVGKIGLESVVNDLSNPEIFGVRPYVRPAKWLGFGLTAIADINPASDFKITQSDGTIDATAAEQFGDPVFLGIGLDAELPVVKSAAFSLIPFADIAGMMPYLRKSVAWNSPNGDPAPFGQQDQLQSWLLLPMNADKTLMATTGLPLRNYGIAAGLIGNIAVFNFRFEYRNYNGIFKPSFYDTLYERNRSQYVKEYFDYISGAKSIATGPTVEGVYGEGSLSVMSDKIKVALGYMMPFSKDTSIPLMDIMKNDFFKLSFVLAKGTIPKLDVSGSISYERRGLAYTFFKDKPDNVKLFDENTVFKGEFAYPVAPMIDLAAVINTAAQRDAIGNVVYDPSGNTKMVPVISIETRVHF